MSRLRCSSISSRSRFARSSSAIAAFELFMPLADILIANEKEIVALLEGHPGPEVLHGAEDAGRFGLGQLDRDQVLHVLVAVLRRADEAQRRAVAGIERRAVERRGQEHARVEQVVDAQHGAVAIPAPGHRVAEPVRRGDPRRDQARH